MIQVSNSPYGANIVFARKKDGGLRLCIDYRLVNKITVRDRTPLPTHTEIRQRVRGAKYLSKIDIRDAFHMVRIDAPDCYKTAFQTRYGLFEYTVSPFGLSNSPAVFMKLMNRIFHDMTDRQLIFYVDDVLIYSNNLEDHLKDIAEVFRRLEKHHLHVKLSKCEFAVDKLEWCGMEVSTEGFAIQKSQIDAMCDYPSFKPDGKVTVTTYVQQFLGSVRFFADFIPWLGEIAAPLYELTKKDNTKSWNVHHQSVQRIIQHYLVTSPQLKFFDPTLPTGIKTDASDHAIGGWLYQTTPEGLTNIVAYWSRKLISAETHYPVHERELLAIHDFVERFRVYLFGIPFDCFTDHKGLEHIQTQPKLSSRQVRWIQYLQDFDFTIEYLPGKSNTFADWLSRRPDFADHLCAKCSQPVTKLVGEKPIQASHSAFSLTTIINFQKFQDQIKSQQQTDPFCIELDSYLVSPKLIPASMKGFVKSFTKREDTWFYQTHALVVPDDTLRLQLLEYFHDRVEHGHKGARRTYQNMVELVYWKDLFADIEKFVASCAPCQRSKPGSSRHGLLHPLNIPDERFESVNIDFKPLPTSLLGNDNCLIIIDRLTKLVELIPCKQTSSAEDIALLFYQRWFLKGHGTPKSIISDRDSLFTSRLWKSFTQIAGIELFMSTARHQQTDGGAEVMVKELKIALSKSTNHRQDNWEELLPSIQYAHNNSIHSTTKLKPFYMAYSFDPKLKLTDKKLQTISDSLDQHDVALENAYRAISQSQMTMQHDYNRNHDVSPNYKVGDKVLLKREGISWSPTSTQSQKLLQPFIGPFEVTAVKADGLNVELKLPFWMKCHKEFHISLVKLWIEPTKDFPDRTNAAYNPPPVAIDEDGNDYEVEAIIDDRMRRKRKEYLIRWKGYDQSHDSWEPLAYVDNCQELIAEYENTKQIHKRSPISTIPLRRSARGAVVNLLFE